MDKQNAAVLERLRQGPLTPLDALSELGVMRLGARIYELRGLGHDISCEIIAVPTRCGRSARVARYSLVTTETGEAEHGKERTETETRRTC